MTTMFPQRQNKVLVLVLLLMLILTGCVGTRLGVDGAKLSLIGDEQHILVAFNDQLVQIDARTGERVQLVNDEGQVRIDNETGQPRVWEILGGNIGGAQFHSDPLIRDESMLVADYQNQKVFTVDQQTARVLDPEGESIEGQVIAGLVAVDGDTLLLGYNASDLQAISLETWEEEWRFDTENAVWSAPLVDNGVAFVSSMDHFVYAIDTDNGEELWKTDLEGAIVGAPVLYENTIYVGSFAHKFFALDADTGEVLNTFDTANWVWGSPTVYDNTVYVTDLGGNVYALKTDTLEEIWSIQVENGGIAPSPLVTEDYVIVGTRLGYLYWLNRETGSVAFEQQVEAEIMSDLLLIEPTETLNIPEPLVVVSTMANDKILVAFNLENSARQWVYGR